MPQEPRDYDRVELVWPGKRTEVERVRLPFQTIERVNDVRASAASGAQGGLLTSASQLPEWWPEGWRNRLIWGDNKYVLASLIEEFAGKVDLIYIDPPFAVGADFSFKVAVGTTTLEKQPSAIEELAYRDTWGARGERYYQYIYERLVLAKDLLSNTGSIYV
ncbi:MAG: site-specific DNA-methyltransferase, partial [Dehalococcoidia bacterium]